MTETSLRELWASGELPARYREVPALLAELDDAGLRRAGTVLSRVDAAEVLHADPALTAVTVAVTGSSALQPFQAPLTAQLARHGFVPRVRLGGYRQYTMELLDPANPMFEHEPDVTLCVLDADDLFTRLATPWSVDDVALALDAYASTVEGLVEAYGAAHPGPLVLTTIPLPRHWAAQVVDLKSRAGLGIAWREFNARLLRLGVERTGVFVIDTDPLVGVAGSLLDPRLAGYTKIQFSDGFFAAFAREVGHLVRAVRGRTSKCLVLDLDGTIWGGILAEDGPAGIVTGDGALGEAFTAVQKAVRQLASQGPLLAVCSKNDAELVRTALRDNEKLALRENDLVALVANWGAKPDNLRQLAEQLNIGTDSLVFIDDSPSERGLVRASLPEVAVIAVDAEEPALHLHRLLADGWFTTQQITDDDHVRGERYRTDRKRLEFRERTESLSDYLAQLGTTVELFRPADADIGRIAQITQRTNQFNLATVRLDAAAVAAALADPRREVFGIRCADRFGDHGTVGAVFVTRSAGTQHIDNFLLSCRVLARGVEEAVLHTVLGRARDAGAAAVTAEYRPTTKNAGVADLYPRQGFRPIERSRKDGAAAYVHDLAELPGAVAHVDIRVLTPVH
jgi:FkbH-like protein